MKKVMLEQLEAEVSVMGIDPVAVKAAFLSAMQKTGHVFEDAAPKGKGKGKGKGRDADQDEQ